MSRTTPLRRSSPLPRGETPLPRSRKPMKQTRHRKCWRHLRDPKYKAWVRERGCHIQSFPGHACAGRVEFAHLKNEGNGGADFANGLPLCAGAHRLAWDSFHILGRRSFAKRWHLDLEGIVVGYARNYLREFPDAPYRTPALPHWSTESPGSAHPGAPTPKWRPNE